MDTGDKSEGVTELINSTSVLFYLFQIRDNCVMFFIEMSSVITARFKSVSSEILNMNVPSDSAYSQSVFGGRWWMSDYLLLFFLISVI